MDAYLGEADDFHVNVNLCTARDLLIPSVTVRDYFDRMKEAFPDLLVFDTREGGDVDLDGGDEEGGCRWLAMEPRRVCSGMVNPSSLAEAYRLHEHALEMAPHLLTISPPDCEALDLAYGFDFTYEGNHDAIVAEALGVGPALEGLLDRKGARVVHYEPTITLALDESCRLQARLRIETRTNVSQVVAGAFEDDQISLYFTVRQHWGHEPVDSFKDSFHRQRTIAEAMIEAAIIPRVVRPLARAIASR